MRILELKAMRGPNYWSVKRHRLVVMRLDIEDLEERPTDKIPGFYERLKEMLPTMYSHRCSEEHEGGFFERVQRGTWMGHVIEHIALEIQTLAGMETGFGRTRGTGEHGVYNVVFSYVEEAVGLYSAKAAVRIAEALIDGQPYRLEEDIQRMRELREDTRLGPSTGSIVEEATKRGIPYLRLNGQSLVQLGHGVHQKRIRATITSNTSNIGVEIACDKEETKDLLESYEIPVPKGRVVRTEEGLVAALESVGFPCVIKPIGGNHGRGATIGIKNLEEAKTAMEVAKEISRSVVVEKEIKGLDHRLLVIDHKFVAAAKRTPACVVGDGKLTIQELVAEVNKDPRRGFGHENVLTQITIDTHTLELLQRRDMTPTSIPVEGDTVYLKATANLSTGGTATDVTELVHSYNVFMAERISRIIDLDICGIDIMTDDITVPLSENGAVLEVNAAPGFRMHLDPTEGLGRNVAEPVVDMLFPPGAPSRIPIIAVTGTNGKTTTTRLIAHIMRSHGNRVGMTCSDGVYIMNRLLMQGDCTGPVSAQFVLKDPLVDMAVLETARGGMVRSGLGFESCDVGICTNVAADHLGLKDINTLEDLANVKGTVPRSVRRDGYAILNADDDLVMAMRKQCDCKIALFSLDENNRLIRQHCKLGGLAAVYENGFITISKGEWKLRIEKAVNVPLTLGGKAVFNIQNILPAVLAAYVQGVKMEELKESLSTFVPSPAQTPGRLNLFQFKNFQVVVDYAHNPHGFEALGRFLSKVPDSPKVGVIAGVGDRRDEDTVTLGRLSAQMFDEIIIRQDRNLRGKSDDDIIALMMKGIQEVDPKKKVTIIKKEDEAIRHAISTAKPGSFLTLCSDVVPDALALVMKLKEEEDRVPFNKEDIPNLNRELVG
ncbi:MAG: cyanophycin synthetase [Flavobacteriales bacterium]|jgi:cyanophycin synthetase|nr:cyanophycin synthetase [Flavobacteriales bacterium]MBK7247740.1 cyanophycin synthetase [Flavobacteriales bacterium]MBK9597105.1 cyanophycin synthetase [Flavobacteriales bacterium]QQS73012.1 MAG: cyanophycin synthetase [Flavobacteriales bacterium]HQV39525.1 cyanophycin synthetase [Flavobacteriales bacterium]